MRDIFSVYAQRDERLVQKKMMERFDKLQFTLYQ